MTNHLHSPHTSLHHVGFIPDGVRRWAQVNNVDLSEAYTLAMVNIADFIDYWFSHNVKELSIYLLSKENMLRPTLEYLAILEGEATFFDYHLPNLLKKWDYELRIAGSLAKLPQSFVEKINKAKNDSTHGSFRKINLLIAYSPFDELRFAISEGGSDIASSLWVNSSLDILIRSSGEQRISNFLPLQSAYAELFFIDKFLNDVSVRDFKDIRKKYDERNRRWGR